MDMNYSNYIKFLESRNIKLFDHDIRISYFELSNILITTNQRGGGTTSEIENRLSKYNNTMLNIILNISISNTPNNLNCILCS